MNVSDIVSIGAMVASFASLYLVFRRAPFVERIDKSQGDMSLDESVSLARKRALEAEKELDAEKDRFVKALKEEQDKLEAIRKESSNSIFLLTQRVKLLEQEKEARDAQPYRITFEAIFGPNPSAQNVVIEHITERRKEEISVEHDRRMMAE